MRNRNALLVSNTVLTVNDSSFLKSGVHAIHYVADETSNYCWYLARCHLLKYLQQRLQKDMASNF